MRPQCSLPTPGPNLFYCASLYRALFNRKSCKFCECQVKFGASRILTANQARRTFSLVAHLGPARISNLKPNKNAQFISHLVYYIIPNFLHLIAIQIDCHSGARTVRPKCVYNFAKLYFLIINIKFIFGRRRCLRNGLICISFDVCNL